VTDELTAPERAAEAHLRRQSMPDVFALGGCRVCVHRTMAFGWADCGLSPQLKFPRCIEQPGGFVRDVGEAA